MGLGGRQEAEAGRQVPGTRVTQAATGCGSELPARAGAPLTPSLALPSCIAATPATTRTTPTWGRVTSSPGWTRGCRGRAWGSAGGSPFPHTWPTGKTGLVGLLHLSSSPEPLTDLPLLCPLTQITPQSLPHSSILFSRAVPPLLPFHLGGLLSVGRGMVVEEQKQHSPRKQRDLDLRPSFAGSLSVLTYKMGQFTLLGRVSYWEVARRLC